MREGMKTDGAEMLEAAGATNINVFDDPYRLGEGIHEMGTARMSATPETGCVDAFNRVHEIPNLYVTDGAFMTSAGCQNPSLTYMAFTARAADHAAKPRSCACTATSCGVPSWKSAGLNSQLRTYHSDAPPNTLSAPPPPRPPPRFVVPRHVLGGARLRRPERRREPSA